MPSLPKLNVMAKSSTRRVILNINGKEEDASGWQTFSYGKLGEVTEKSLSLPRVPHTQTQYALNPQPVTHNP